MKDNASSVTGNITVIKKRFNGQDHLIKTYFNGKEVSAMFDTGSPISTINCNDATKGRIIKVEQKKTNSRGCKARVNSTGSGKKEDMELALKKDTFVEIGISLRFDKKYFDQSHFRFVIFSLV